MSTPRERARVTLVDGSAHDLHGTRIEGDRVVAGTFTSPLSDVRRVELREFSAGRTVGLATGVAGVLLVIGFVITKGIEDDIGDIQF